MLLMLLACKGDPVEQIFTGEIFTDATTTTSAIAVSGGVVVATGEEAEAMRGEGTQAVALTGTAFPGFHDAHAHFSPGSFVMERLVMLGTSSMDSILNATADYAEEAPDEPWIIGAAGRMIMVLSGSTPSRISSADSTGRPPGAPPWSMP